MSGFGSWLDLPLRLADHAHAIKRSIPGLRSVRLNFICLHYGYIVSTSLACAVIIYGGGRVRFIDALYLSTGASTQSGLNPVNINSLRGYQQVGLYLLSMITSPIFINMCVVFVRLFWFERRFRNIVKDAKALRRTRDRSFARGDRGGLFRRSSRMGGGGGGRGSRGGRNDDADVDADDDDDEVDEDDLESNRHRRHRHRQNGVRGKPIVVPRDASGHMRGRHFHGDALEPEMLEKGDSDSGMSVESDPRAMRRLPAPRAAEQHIAFLEQQRNESGALRIPGPREFDLGGGPQALGEGDETPQEQAEAEKEEREEEAEDEKDRHRREEGEGGKEEGVEEEAQSPRQRSRGGGGGGGHITIDEPDMRRLRSRSRTLAPSSTTRKDEREDDGLWGGPTRQLTQLLRSFTTAQTTTTTTTAAAAAERELPYLSWQPTIGRNSAFVDLTEEQRDELGGIEYRSLKTLAVILVCFYVFFHVLGVVCLVPWILHTRWGGVLEAAGQKRPWWGIFTAASAFNDQGYTLTADSMESFEAAIFPLLLMSFLIVIGNTGFPCILRLTIWLLALVVPEGSSLWEELHFLLDHPRRCFTLLFPRAPTWWLAFVLLVLNGVDLIFFVILDLNDRTVTTLPGGLRFVDGLFQAIATRTAGFSVISLSDLHPAIQVSYMVMMYISVLPIAISVRRTNVYEERSLGIYSPPEDEDEDERGDGSDADTREPSYVAAHLRRQLSFDLWYIFLGLFLIAIIEGHQLMNDAPAFSLFTILFEIVSAYGCVGLTLGYPTTDAAFSSQFHVLSKLIMIAMELRGRHRGLPYDLDRAVLLPSEGLHRAEQDDAARRLRRRPSAASASSLSGVSPVRSQSQLELSRSRSGGTATGGGGGDDDGETSGAFRVRSGRHRRFPSLLSIGSSTGPVHLRLGRRER